MAGPATGDEEIGRRVRERRDALRIKQSDLARRIGRSQGWVSSFERGQYSTDTAGMQTLARALDVTVGWLYGEPSLPRRTAELYAVAAVSDRERFSKALTFLLEPEEQEPPA